MVQGGQAALQDLLEPTTAVADTRYALPDSPILKSALILPHHANVLGLHRKANIESAVSALNCEWLNRASKAGQLKGGAGHYGLARTPDRSSGSAIP